MYLSMFGFSGFEISMIIGYEKSYFFKKKCLSYFLKKALENIILQTIQVIFEQC